MTKTKIQKLIKIADQTSAALGGEVAKLVFMETYKTLLDLEREKEFFKNSRKYSKRNAVDQPVRMSSGHAP